MPRDQGAGTQHDLDLVGAENPDALVAYGHGDRMRADEHSVGESFGGPDLREVLDVALLDIAVKHADAGALRAAQRRDDEVQVDVVGARLGALDAVPVLDEHEPQKLRELLGTYRHHHPVPVRTGR